MVASGQLARPTLARFLPAVVVVMVIVPLVEPLIRRHDVLRSLEQIDLPLAVGEPLLMAIGYALGLWLVRSRITPETLRRSSLHLIAGVLAVFCLGITSVFSQGAHLPFIITASVGSGLGVALVLFGFHSSPSPAATRTVA